MTTLRIMLMDESGTLYPVTDPEDNVLDYDLSKPLARAEIIEQIQDAIQEASQ